jgi:S-formylglutathione hydrolase FrmB
VSSTAGFDLRTWVSSPVDEWKAPPYLPSANGYELDDALTGAGVEHVFDELPAGSGHAWSYTDLVIDDVTAWFQSRL